ncbi:hypothetical protein D9M73_180100 [compost metagenome]
MLQLHVALQQLRQPAQAEALQQAVAAYRQIGHEHHRHMLVQARGDPVVEGEGEVRAEDGDGFLAVAVGVAVVIHWNLPAGWRAGPGIQHRPGRKALHGRVDSSPAGPMDGQANVRAKKWRVVDRSPLPDTIPEGVVEMNP